MLSASIVYLRQIGTTLACVSLIGLGFGQYLIISDIYLWVTTCKLKLKQCLPPETLFSESDVLFLSRCCFSDICLCWCHTVPNQTGWPNE